MYPQRVNGYGNQYLVLSEMRQADVSRRHSTRLCVDDGFTSVEIELNPAQFKVLLAALEVRRKELEAFGKL